MKKGVLILLGMFMMVSTVEAKAGENLPNRFGLNYTYNNAVNFFERGIEFFVFTNGDFDFDTNYTNRRVRIDKDYRGRIRRIGNVSLRYDFRGNVTRIGNISIQYFRNQLTNVGNLRVRYDRWGTPFFYGNVRDFYYNNGIRFNISFGDICNYNDAYFYRNDFRQNYSQIREDINFYYYRARPNARIGKRSTIIKRRKLNSTARNYNATGRNNKNSSYRKNDTRKKKSSVRNSKNSYRKSDISRNIKRNSDTKNRKIDSKKEKVNRSSKTVNRKMNSINRKSNSNKKVKTIERKEEDKVILKLSVTKNIVQEPS